MTKRPFRLQRRTFLRGAVASFGSVALGLPLLDSMLNNHGDALADGGSLPQRFVVWFWGNGSDPSRWAPSTEGGDYQLTEMLAGLAPIKNYVNVVSGTRLPVAGLNNPHVEGAVGILSGGDPLIHDSYSGQSNDWDYLTVPAPSVDQLIATHIAGPTPFRSITTAVANVHTTSAGSSNTPGTAVSYISHSAPYNFNPPVMDPRELFVSLFDSGLPLPDGTDKGPGPSELARAGALDAVLEDAAQLKQRLGATDRLRLDAHLEGIYELQNRISGAGGSLGESCGVPANPGNSDSYRERAKAMADLIAMSFACDRTRVATMEFSSPASQDRFPDIYAPGELTVNGQETSFHEYEHLRGIDTAVRKGLTYFVDLYADFCQSLQAIPEAGGTLLDGSCVLGTSDVSSGPNHGFTDYPLLIAGRAHGALRYPGVHVRASGDLATRVPFTCMKALGLPQSSWGTGEFFVDSPVNAVLS